MSAHVSLDTRCAESVPRVVVRELPAIMSPAQLAKELDVSVRTLERWRVADSGPEFQHREGTTFYRYYGTDVVAWLENKKPAGATAGQNINA